MNRKFDDIKFSYRLPNGRDGEDFFTRDLGCTRDKYEVTAGGRLVQVTCNARRRRIEEDLNYSGWLDIRSSAGHYRLEFMSGNLRALQEIGSEEWVPFNSALCMLGKGEAEAQSLPT